MKKLSILSVLKQLWALGQLRQQMPRQLLRPFKPKDLSSAAYRRDFLAFQMQMIMASGQGWT